MSILQDVKEVDRKFIKILLDIFLEKMLQQPRGINNLGRREKCNLNQVISFADFFTWSRKIVYRYKVVHGELYILATLAMKIQNYSR